MEDDDPSERKRYRGEDEADPTVEEPARKARGTSSNRVQEPTDTSLHGSTTTSSALSSDTVDSMSLTNDDSTASAPGQDTSQTQFPFNNDVILEWLMEFKIVLNNYDLVVEKLLSNNLHYAIIGMNRQSFVDLGIPFADAQTLEMKLPSLLVRWLKDLPPEKHRSLRGEIKCWDQCQALLTSETLSLPLTQSVTPLSTSPQQRKRLSSSDFLLMEELPRIFRPPIEIRKNKTKVSPNFRPLDWIPSTLPEIENHIAEYDPDSGMEVMPPCIAAVTPPQGDPVEIVPRAGPTRVPPSCMVACSRGGKTATLQEIGHQLQEKGYNVIFITFNSNTSVDHSESTWDPIDSLCTRIACAIAKPEVIGQRVDKYHLNFTTDPEKDIKEWLHLNNCILLIDEFNQLLVPGDTGSERKTKEKNLAGWLKGQFLSMAGRYFVFSSHLYTMAKSLERYMYSYSSRPLYLLPPPQVTDEEEWTKLRLEIRSQSLAFLQQPVLVSYAPSLYISYLCDSSQSTLESFLTEKVFNYQDVLLSFLFESQPVNPLTHARNADPITSAAKREALDQLCRYSENAERIWVPLFFPKIMEEFDEALNRLPDVLMLPLGEGKVYENVIRLALWFRSRAFYECQMKFSEHTSAFLPPYQTINGQNPEFLAIDFKAESIAEYCDLMRKETSDHTHCVLFSGPTHPSFEQYDLFILYKRPSSTVIYGYQMKKNDELPLTKDLPDSQKKTKEKEKKKKKKKMLEREAFLASLVDVSVWIRKDTSQRDVQKNRQGIWRIPTTTQKRALLRATFSELEKCEAKLLKSASSTTKNLASTSTSTH